MVLWMCFSNSLLGLAPSRLFAVCCCGSYVRLVDRRVFNGGETPKTLVENSFKSEDVLAVDLAPTYASNGPSKFYEISKAGP